MFGSRRFMHNELTLFSAGLCENINNFNNFKQ